MKEEITHLKRANSSTITNYNTTTPSQSPQGTKMLENEKIEEQPCPVGSPVHGLRPDIELHAKGAQSSLDAYLVGIPLGQFTP